MLSIRLFTYISVGLLLIDATIELALVGTTLTWRNGQTSGWFDIARGESIHNIYGRPPEEYAIPTYISLAAAVVAFVLIGLGGVLCFILQSGLDLSRRLWTRVIYGLWIVLLTPSAVLTLAALTLTWLVNDSIGGLDSLSIIYSDGPWTLEIWLNAILQQKLIHERDRDEIDRQVAIIRGWRINLVSLFIIGVATSVFGRWDAFQRHKVSSKRNDRDDTNMSRANESSQETQGIVRYELPG